MTDGLRLALTLLTVARVRGPARLDRRTAGVAISLAPAIGLLLGLAAAAVLAGLGQLTEGPLLPAVCALGALAALTRGLHLDGLADTADGLASYLPAPEARRVMKTPDVGALGLVAVVLVLGVQAAALAACAAAGRGTLSLLLAAVLSRVAVSAACTPRTPAAAPDGLGALVAGTVRPVLPLLAGVAAVAGAVLWELPGAGAVRPLLAAGVALAAGELLRRHAVRRLGGISGDVLGALVELTTAVVLLVMAMALP